MPLDLNNTATQIDRMALDLKARRSDREQRLQRALKALNEFSVDDYTLAREQAGEALAWAPPDVLEAPNTRHAPEPLPADFCVAAADGSHIDIDRHLPVRCFLINTGVSVLVYGSKPDAHLTSQARLYAEDEELVIRDPVSYQERAIEGPILGAKRAVEEIRALLEAVRDPDEATPTLALLDGSLMMLGLVSHYYPDFVMRELIEEGFVQALDELGDIAKDRSLAVASYISLPDSAEVVRALRLTVCEYTASEAEYRCGLQVPGQRPCERCVGGVLDRDLFSQVLEPGERSALFATSSRAVKDYYGKNGVRFFYINAGEEIGRVEVPAWVAENRDLLALAHSLVVDQCGRGRGYPVSLMEAHEQAAVTGADRRYFVQLVERALYDQDMPVFTSEKSRSKRLRWL